MVLDEQLHFCNNKNNDNYNTLIGTKPHSDEISGGGSVCLSTFVTRNRDKCDKSNIIKLHYELAQPGSTPLNALYSSSNLHGDSP